MAGCSLLAACGLCVACATCPGPDCALDSASRSIAQVRAYKDFFPPVLELLATYCTLLMVWDSVELPRTGVYVWVVVVIGILAQKPSPLQHTTGGFGWGGCRWGQHSNSRRLDLACEQVAGDVLWHCRLCYQGWVSGRTIRRAQRRLAASLHL
jgi:hypothetical protein